MTRPRMLSPNERSAILDQQLMATPPVGARKVPAQPQGYWDVTLEFC
jgi:hypothetical protein